MASCELNCNERSLQGAGALDPAGAPAPENDRPQFRDYLTIFLASCAVMIYQITLTRILSVVVWYHFAFLTISMVMLGLGVPGVWFALMKRPLRLLPWFLLASGVATPLSVALIVKFGAILMGKSIAYVVLCVLPATLSLGAVVCLLLIRASGVAITRMYGIDLLGAGLGAMSVIPLMHVVPTPILSAAAGLLPLAGLLFYRSRLRFAGAALLVLWAASLVHGGFFKVTHSKTKDEEKITPVFEDWSPLARITIFDESFFYLEKHKAGFSWGRGSLYPGGEPLRQYWLEQDGSAGSPISEFRGDLAPLGNLLYDVTTVGYQLRSPQRVAVIGAGGGRDILSALLAGASDIDAVEINSHTIDAVSDTFGWLSGDIYHFPGVNAVASEGRSYLTHTDQEYDLIQISLIDSWAASAAGAFALAENNLYTVEAFQLYGRRLRKRGIISTSRWMNEMPRLIVLAHSALAAMGIENPARHIVIIQAGWVGTLLSSTDPFSEDDIARLRGICASRGFSRLYPVAPGETPANAFIADAVDRGLAPLEEMGLNIEPPTDDSPYFFHILSPFRKYRGNPNDIPKLASFKFNVQSSEVLRQVMVIVIAIALVLFMLPFAARLTRAQPGEPLPHLLRASTFFAAIGFSFMLVENVLVQRFVLYLGHPSYATTVIIAGLLLGMGFGSSRAATFGIARLRRLGCAVPVFLLVLVLALPRVITATLGTPIWARLFVSAVILLPLGAAFGLFFPLGMLLFGDRAKPWYWAINGVFGVVASVMSLALSMEFGFLVVGISGAAGYTAAWACLLGSATPPDNAAGLAERARE